MKTWISAAFVRSTYQRGPCEFALFIVVEQEPLSCVDVMMWMLIGGGLSVVETRPTLLGNHRAIVRSLKVEVGKSKWGRMWVEKQPPNGRQ